jgi:hypothetical protein
MEKQDLCLTGFMTAVIIMILLRMDGDGYWQQKPN